MSFSKLKKAQLSFKSFCNSKMREKIILILASFGAIFGAVPQTRIGFGSICAFIDCSKMKTTTKKPLVEVPKNPRGHHEQDFGKIKTQIVFHLKTHFCKNASFNCFLYFLRMLCARRILKLLETWIN